MKKIILPVVALLFAGCASYHADKQSHLDVMPEAYRGPNYASNWEVSKTRVKETGTAKIIFWCFLSGEGTYVDVPAGHFAFESPAVSLAKSAATYNLLQKEQADALLGVTYSYQISNCFLWKTVKCTVEGFPAYLKGVTLVTDKPAVINKDQHIIRVNSYDTLTYPTGRTRPEGGN